MGVVGMTGTDSFVVTDREQDAAREWSGALRDAAEPPTKIVGGIVGAQSGGFFPAIWRSAAQEALTLPEHPLYRAPEPTEAEKRRYERAQTNEKTGALLRQARLQAGLTQAELGEAVSYTPQQVSRWEQGTRTVPQRIIPLLLDTLQAARDHKRRTAQVLRELAARDSEEW